jgi:hypothetical protein
MLCCAVLCYAVLCCAVLCCALLCYAVLCCVRREGQVATASTYANIFSGLPSCGRPTRLVLYDLHTLQNRHYVHGSCIASLQSTIPVLLERILGRGRGRGRPGAQDGDFEINCVAFPDDGAKKRFSFMFEVRARCGGDVYIYVCSVCSKEYCVCCVPHISVSGVLVLMCAAYHFSAGVRPGVDSVRQDAARGRARRDDPGRERGGQARDHRGRPGADGRHAARGRPLAHRGGRIQRVRIRRARYAYAYAHWPCLAFANSSLHPYHISTPHCYLM